MKIDVKIDELGPNCRYRFYNLDRCRDNLPKDTLPKVQFCVAVVAQRLLVKNICPTGIWLTH
jgi:hypothetical protein